MPVCPREALCAATAVAILTLLAVPGVLLAQEQPDPGATRWSIEAVALGGPGVLVGGAVSFDVFRAAKPRLALEASVLVNSWEDNRNAPCPLPPPGCAAPRKPPFVEELRTFALRGEYPLGASWRVVASTGVVAGDWRRPQGTNPVAFDLGLGFARASRSGRHTIEVRGHRMQTRSYPTYAGRVSWRLRL